MCQHISVICLCPYIDKNCNMFIVVGISTCHPLIFHCWRNLQYWNLFSKQNKYFCHYSCGGAQVPELRVVACLCWPALFPCPLWPAAAIFSAFWSYCSHFFFLFFGATCCFCLLLLMLAATDVWWCLSLSLCVVVVAATDVCWCLSSLIASCEFIDVG